MKTGWRIFWLIGCALLIRDAHAQQVEPVIQTYLSPVSVDLQPKAKLTVAFTLKKDGGPPAQDERQAYVLLYLKQDEAKILKTAQLAAAAKDEATDVPPFVQMLTNEKLVVSLGTQKSQQRRTRRGEPWHRGRQVFPFKFVFDRSNVYEKLVSLEHFDPQRGTQWADGFACEEFGLIVYVPLNSSQFAPLVSKTTHSQFDIGKAYRSASPILYFRPLAYELQFVKYEKFDDDLVLYIVN